MSWIYLNKQMLQSVPQQLVEGMAKKMKDFKEEPITCYLLGTEAMGYKISYTKEGGKKAYQIIGYGTANQQPVLVQLVLGREPRTNNDLPEFARQIIKIAN